MSEKGWRVLLIQSKSDLRCEDEILLVRQGEQTQWVPLAQLRILIFVHLYGNGFCRRTDCEINQALNYGYSIILSQMSRSIVSYGYHTALGIEHHCESNSFNFSCDLMEPFRPIVDHYVYTHQDDLFTAETRKGLIALMYEPIRLDGKNMEVQTAIDLYVHNCIRYMNHECSTISEVTMIAT